MDVGKENFAVRAERWSPACRSIRCGPERGSNPLDVANGLFAYCAPHPIPVSITYQAVRQAGIF